MGKKTTVVLMALLIVLSLALTGCGNSRDDAGADNLNDDLYNDSGDLREDLDDVGDDIRDETDKLGEDIKDGAEDILDGNDKNNHDGIPGDDAAAGK